MSEPDAPRYCQQCHDIIRCGFRSGKVTVTWNVTVTFCEVNAAPYMKEAYALDGLGDKFLIKLAAIL